MLSLSNLRALVAVADFGGIRPAAKRLRRTPSAVSMALKQLEESIGAPLFEGDRKVHPTKLGLFTADAARDVIKHYDNTCGSILAFSRHEISRCTVASVTSIAAAILPEAIRRAKSRSKGFEVMLREVHSTRMADAVADGLVDAGFARIGVVRPDVAVSPLFQDSYNAVCADDHPFARRDDALGWDEICAEPLVANESYGETIHEKLASSADSVQFHVSSASSAFAMVRAGVGITIMPSLARSVAPSGLHFLRINDSEAIRRVGVLTRRGRTLAQATQILLDAARKVVTENASALDIIPLCGQKSA